MSEKMVVKWWSILQSQMSIYGYIQGEENSKVALSTCNGQLTGIIFYGQKVYSIYPHIDGSGRLLDNHYLLNHADMRHANKTSGHNINKDNFKYQRGYEGIQRKFHQRRRREAEDYQIHRPYNANQTSSYVELVLVVDHNLYISFNQDTKEVHRYCKDLVNAMNVLYEPLNIFLALVGVVIWNKSNEIEITSNAAETLMTFLSYRSRELAIKHPNDFALLLTKNIFRDVDNTSILGKAFKGTICTSTHSGGIAAQHSKTLAVVATTMAHEMGHSLGMNDEIENCICPDEACIMNGMSYKNFNPVSWSSCSINSLHTSFSKEITHCLRNKPERLFESPDCGNGFVEPGEECDCGLPDYCKNPCCNAHTCKLNLDALCADGECCDLETCQPKLAGIPCRKAENECDLAEYCTGESEYCPKDVYRRDAESCDGGQAYCFHGNCRSHDHHCRVMWGPHATNSEPCYEQNKMGDRLGHCGYNRPENSFVSCTSENKMCGKLHCLKGNGTLRIGNKFSTNISESYAEGLINFVDCFGAEVDIGSQFLDRGLTPNGAKCGVNRMCVNQSCVAIEEILGAACPENCNNKGICNSRGHCHCDVGFGGESCATSGYGGSQDSGPASSKSTIRQFQYLYLLFLLIIPLVVIFWF
ncbi:disintegrin and metalloproteinase domain-containing protein adm-2-like, partial [Drosophila tropicalis]|uniref:disintegrin and metalloproteinase domain-containing protein adm-2-like n=1 Tax=Drosophila tropicalis TaxID=46794 RepID=UPI0035AC256F